MLMRRIAASGSRLELNASCISALAHAGSIDLRTEAVSATSKIAGLHKLANIWEAARKGSVGRLYVLLLHGELEPHCTNQEVCYFALLALSHLPLVL